MATARLPAARDFSRSVRACLRAAGDCIGSGHPFVEPPDRKEVTPRSMPLGDSVRSDSISAFPSLCCQARARGSRCSEQLASSSSPRLKASDRIRPTASRPLLPRPEQVRNDPSGSCHQKPPTRTTSPVAKAPT